MATTGRRRRWKRRSTCTWSTSRSAPRRTPWVRCQGGPAWRYGRVLKMARRPTPDEYSKVVLITGLGIAAIGALGFVIYLIMRYGPGVFHGIFGYLGR